MTYTLQALLARSEPFLSGAPTEGAHVVALPQGFQMLLFTRAFIKKHQLAFLPLTDVAGGQLPVSIHALCAALSKGNRVAYVEAEFFGGAGMQACAVFRDGAIELGPLRDESAINAALALLGVQRQSFRDEFEALGLNAHRDTEEWVK